MAKGVVADPLFETILDLGKRINTLLIRQGSNPRRRIFVALAGVPGSGKSTVSHALLLELAARGIHHVAIVPMDGFHYTKKALLSFDDAEAAFQRRGAPFTFDAEAFVGFIKTLKAIPVTGPDEAEIVTSAPSFDHAIKDPVPNAIPVSSRTRLVIVEGNYTLLNQRPWCEIADFSDEKWFVDIPAHIARDRLAKRHLAAGIEASMEQAIKRAEVNDLPNGELIRSLLIKPDIIIEN